MNAPWFQMVLTNLILIVPSCYAQLNCFACGLSAFDPIQDAQNYSSDPRMIQFKMYNETCDQFEIMIHKYPNAISKWTRPCPAGVQNCFWAEGQYNNQTPRFRGCASTEYAQDVGCTTEIQAVTIVDQKRSADIQVELCYCDNEKCNFDGNGSNFLRMFDTFYLFFISIGVTCTFNLRLI